MASLVNTTACAVEGRQAIGREMLQRLEYLTSRADNLVCEAAGKFEPVLAPDTANKVLGNDVPSPVYPPMFDSMRSELQKLSGALDRLEDVIRRAEV